jgi:prevent-host-death family protein
MPNIKPVSDLRNYNEVLRDIAVGEPVFLTKNGRGKFAVIAIEEYEKTQATMKLMAELMAADQAIKNGEKWLTEKQLKESLGV